MLSDFYTKVWPFPVSRMHPFHPYPVNSTHASSSAQHTSSWVFLLLVCSPLPIHSLLSIWNSLKHEPEYISHLHKCLHGFWYPEDTVPTLSHTFSLWTKALRSLVLAYFSSLTSCFPPSSSLTLILSLNSSHNLSSFPNLPCSPCLHNCICILLSYPDKELPHQIYVLPEHPGPWRSLSCALLGTWIVWPPYFPHCAEAVYITSSLIQLCATWDRDSLFSS